MPTTALNRPAAFVVKAEVQNPEADAFSFRQKTMYRGKEIAVGDTIFIFASDHRGGQGLMGRGVVEEVERGPGIWVRIEVRRTGQATRPLGRAHLKPFCELTDAQPQTEIARKLYRQATNKVAGISNEAAAFLAEFFE